MLDKFHSRRALLGTAILAAGLLAGPLMPGHAFALYSSCRSDPKVQLSDGSVVTLQATISDDAADIRNIQYTLHAPVGTTVTDVVYTGGPFAAKETLQVYADNPANTYDSDTVVSTGANKISVETMAQVSSADSVVSGSTSGYNAQILHVRPTGSPSTDHGRHGANGHNNG